MELKLTFLGRGYSINKAFYKRSFTRTRECRDWFDSIFSQAIQNGYCELMKEFADAWRISPSGIEITIIRNIPAMDFWTDKKEISLHTMDVTNTEKLMVDALFDEHYHGYTVDGRTYTNLNINDKWVTELHSFKRPVTDGTTSIEIIIRPTQLEYQSQPTKKSVRQKVASKKTLAK